VGTVTGGNTLGLVARSSQFSWAQEAYLPPGALMKDALSPQTQLPGLRLGQSWKVPAYSPLRLSTAPLEVLQATVESRETISWEGELVSCWVVTYRSESGVSLSGSGPPIGRMWVSYRGAVLKQEATLLASTLTFVRMGEERAAVLARKMGTGWNGRAAP
jgi:hypothetical protein